MKNRIAKQVLMICMVSALSVSMPMTSFAASEKKETSQEEKILEVTSKNNKPVIYDKDGVKITVQNTIYDANSGNGFYQIEFMVENNSNKKVLLSMKDSSVDDFSVSTYTGRSSVEANKRGIIDSSIWEKDYKSYDVEDFQNWNSKVIIMLDDEEVLNEDIKISKEVFKSKDDADSEKKTTDTNSSEADSETTDNTSDIEARLSALEDNAKELEEKNEKLENEKKELEEKVKKLEEEKAKQEKEEKKKEKKSKETPAPEPTEAPVEETPAPEATTPEPAAEAEAPATQPVVEYKDATTVRIVQQTLNNVGYNCGNPDGVPGGKTTEAITKYQTDKGITVNGLVTDELLQSLNIVEQVQEAVKAEGSKAEYSSDYTYDQLARNPDTYKGQKVKIKGKVLQADVSGDTCYARIAMNSDYNTVVFVTYDKDLLGYRLLDDDIVTVYGSDLGTYSYEAVSGASITLPWLHAAIIEM